MSMLHVVNTSTPGNPIIETENTWRYSETLAMHHHIRIAMCACSDLFGPQITQTTPHDVSHM